LAAVVVEVEEALSVEEMWGAAKVSALALQDDR